MMSASGRTSRVQTEEARDGSLSVGLGCLLPCISPLFLEITGPRAKDSVPNVAKILRS